MQKRHIIRSYESSLHRASFSSSFASSSRCRHFFSLVSQLHPTICWPTKVKPSNLLRKNSRASLHSLSGSSRRWCVESLTSFSGFASKCSLRSLHESWKPWMVFKMRFRSVLLWSDGPNRFSSDPVSCRHAIRLAVTPRTVMGSI